MKILYTLEEFASKNVKLEIGKKAESLVEMTRLGANVPEAFVIGAEILEKYWESNDLSILVSKVIRITNVESDEAKQDIAALQQGVLEGQFHSPFLQSLESMLGTFSNSHFAIRSSGSCEDLEGASFAGLYETTLNVQGLDNICEAIKKCWSSLFNASVIQYCLNKNIPLSQMLMSVIVQRMIPADKSGVLFSVNPLTGIDTHMLIEACFGLGEALVGGELTPDQYVFDWYGEEVVSRTINEKIISLIAIPEAPFVQTVPLTKPMSIKEVLSGDEVRALVRTATDIQEYFGFPVDVEWVMQNGKIYIVQSRPITQINHAGIDGEWTTANFKDGGVSSTVCTPFMWSLYDYVWESELPRFIKAANCMGEDVVSSWGEMYFGRPYWNIDAVKNGLKRLPGYIERSFDEDVGVAVNYEGDGFVTKTTPGTIFAGIRAITALNKSFRQAEGEWKTFTFDQRARLIELKDLNVDQYTEQEFFAFYESFINEEYFKSEAGYFNLIYNATNFSTLFKESIKSIKSEVGFIDLISGLEGISHLSISYGIWDVSRDIISDTDAKRYWDENSVDKIVQGLGSGEERFLLKKLRKLVAAHCFNSTRELDITVPRHGEDPSFLVESIRSSLDLDDSFDPRANNKIQSERFLEAKAIFSQSIPFYRRKSVLSKLERLRAFLWWREEYRGLSTHFYYFVRKYTLKLAPVFSRWEIIEEANDMFFLTKDEVIQVLRNELSHVEAKERVVKNKVYYRSFEHFDNPNELGGKYSAAGVATASVGTEEGAISGIPCSPGIVEGTVKVIKNIFDADRLEKGDILITKFSDPGWTPKFSFISAVATETGGVLSHAAVISREYGIPAVLAIPGLTSLLKDGQRIRIDGTAGTIEVMNSEGEYT
ncbi:MAG: hypothetical protein COA42_14270 [Alteromonadaceae bacterium]|nr:MAG: hypothetical protein COA42_14270 [Alteromonadaceae bacterium]